MRHWLRGKCGGLVGFLLIAAMVTGGLGWVTAAVLRLEREQRAARGETELVGRLRLALWQLDSLISSDLSREDARPYHDYRPPPRQKGRPVAAPVLAREELPDWILLHFEASKQGWQSPQLLKLPVPSPPPRAQMTGPGEVRRRELALEELKAHWHCQELLALVRQRKAELVANTSVLATGNDGNELLQQAGNTAQNINPAQNFRGDYDKRLAVQSRRMQNTSTSPAREPVTVRLSRQLVPLWLAGRDGSVWLVLARRVQVGSRQLCQGVVLDWPRLQQVLAEQINELFPRARLLPMRDQTPPRPERTMTALPVELDPGEAAVLPAAGWTPLRIGLAVAWAAVLVALLATGLGGWSLLDLSERRSRFVSAVTHELRTPLTTLRLYLDMLTSGMVQDEKQKAEYLQTLHAEADRLNRLIANVLDFSRLEKQRPRLEKTRVVLADVLEQLRSTWQARCQDADKELVIVNEAGEGAALETDVNLLYQVLGNLIDNACKYSRSAADRRLWLRARRGHRQVVLEVEDRGPGIPARERRAIFRPFRRGRGADVTAGGVGLGLALARRWAVLLGGRLTVQAAQETGACFRLELPTG
jgi:signal transduction histidine kinase